MQNYTFFPRVKLFGKHYFLPHANFLSFVEKFSFERIIPIREIEIASAPLYLSTLEINGFATRKLFGGNNGAEISLLTAMW